MFFRPHYECAEKTGAFFFFFLAYVLLYFPYDWVDILQMLYDENETSHYKEQQHLNFYLIFKLLIRS